jgi:hypothetical protein
MEKISIGPVSYVPQFGRAAASNFGWLCEHQLLNCLLLPVRLQNYENKSKFLTIANIHFKVNWSIFF